MQDIFQKIDREILGIYMRYGAPGTVQRNALVDWQYDAVGYHGTYGLYFVAANSICQVVFQCTSVINQGVGQAQALWQEIPLVKENTKGRAISR